MSQTLAFLSTRGLTFFYVLLAAAWMLAGRKPMAIYFLSAAAINESVLAMNAGR